MGYKAIIMLIFLFSNNSFSQELLGKNAQGKVCAKTAFLRNIHCEGDTVHFSEKDSSEEKDWQGFTSYTTYRSSEGFGTIEKFEEKSYFGEGKDVYATINVSEGTYRRQSNRGIASSSQLPPKVKESLKGQKILVPISDIYAQNNRKSKDDPAPAFDPSKKR